MALTLEAEQLLQKVGLVQFFEQNETRYRGFVARAYNYVVEGFPTGAIVRRDDVAKALLPMLEVDPGLLTYLAARKLKEKYWRKDFGDLILDQCWLAVAGAQQEG